MSDQYDWEQEDKEVQRNLDLLDEECLCDPHDPGNEDGCPHELAKAFFQPGGHAEELVTAIEKQAVESLTAQSRIYGGTGENWTAPRRIVALVELPDRRKETFQARNLLLESDIREAMAKGARRLYDRYVERYSVLGFEFDPDTIEYDLRRLAIGMDQGADTAIPHTEGLARTLVATVLIKRPA